MGENPYKPPLTPIGPQEGRDHDLNVAILTIIVSAIGLALFALALNTWQSFTFGEDIIISQ